MKNKQENVLFSLTVLVENDTLVIERVSPSNLPFDRNMLEAILVQFDLSPKVASRITEILDNAQEDIEKELR